MIADGPPPVEAVVVSGARLPDPVGDAAFSILRLDDDALRDNPRLDEALAAVPGLSLFRRTSSLVANPTIQGVSLRSIGGSGASRALVTLDGAPQGDPFGGWVIWSSLPSETIGSVRIVRGAGAGPYGPGALTGVIALTSRDLAPGAFALEAGAGSLGDRQGQAIGAVSLGGGVLTVSAAGERSDGYIPVRAGRGAADQPLDLHAWTAAARWTGDVGAAVLDARLDVFDEDRGAGLAGAVSRADGGQASLSLTRAPAPGEAGYQLRAWARRSDLLNTSVTVAPGRAGVTPADDQYATPATGYGVGGLARWIGALGSLEVGADGQGAVGESRERFRVVSGRFTRLRFSGGETFTGGAYVEASHQAGPWTVTGGGRLDGWADVASHRLEFAVAGGAPTLAQHTPDQAGVLPSGRIAIRRDLAGGAYVRTAAYAGFRPATLNELDRPFRVGADVTQANPTLRPERLYGAEAGLGAERADWSWSATGFYNRLADAVIDATVRAGPFTDPVEGVIPAGGTLFQRRNVQAIDAWGLEADLARHWSGIDARLAGDYTHARVEGGGAAPNLTGLRPAETPRLTLTAGADWRPLPRLGLTAQARYESARFDDDLNTRRLAPAASLDLRADYHAAAALTLFAAVDNVADAAVETGRTADGVVSYAPPRRFTLGLTYRR